MMIGGTTGATNETNFDTSYSSEKSQNKRANITINQRSKLFSNTNLTLNIDTEAINSQFNFGGEKGQLMRTEE